MLVGRAAEQRAVRELLAAARVGAGGALLLTGEPGIGKSALLDAAAEVAVDDGMRVLRATGTRAETDVPFAGLLELLRPVTARVDDLPSPQAEALGVALALRPGRGADRFAVGAAVLGLLARVAEDRPLLVLLDDVHLLDRPSAQALAFTARRLAADPVAVLAAGRDPEVSPLGDAGLPVLTVGGLPADEAAALLVATGHRLDDGAAARLHGLTGGNPLALVELAGELPDVAALPEDAPVPVPTALARVFAGRADRLPSAARTALLVAAAGGSDLVPVARACASLGVPVEALDAAEAAGLLRVDAGSVTFRHGLVRSAVWSEADPPARRAVHRALARAHDGRDEDRYAWHLGESALGPDDGAAAALAAAGERARQRGAHAAAAAALSRAADLSPDPADRASRLVAAAGAAWRGGLSDRAVLLLDRAEPLVQPIRAHAAGLRGTVAARTGSVEQARDILLAAGQDAAASDPDTAVGLLADAVSAAFLLGDTAAVAAAALRLDDLATGARTEAARWLADLASGIAGVVTGQGGPDRIRAAVERIGPDSPLIADRRLEPWLVLGPLFLRDDATGRGLVATVVANVRRRTDLGGLPFLLFQVARDAATRDAWDAGEVAYAEGIRLAREAEQWTDLAGCLAGLAWLEARQGREERCRQHTDEAVRLSGERGLHLFRAWSSYALGEVDLAAGRADGAAERFRALEEFLSGIGFRDVDLSPVPDLVEACAHAGRAAEAVGAAEDHAVRAREKGTPWAMARAERARAIVAADDDVDELFAAAVGHHERTADVFELARTELAWGARLRRARRRVDAREKLAGALAAFDRLGAGPWAERAARELRATGVTARRRTAGAAEELTPQERQIAGLLADGRTTREVAAALFLSPKTVEYHLRHVYVKLGIGSRTELAERMAAAAAGVPVPERVQGRA